MKCAVKFCGIETQNIFGRTVIGAEGIEELQKKLKEGGGYWKKPVKIMREYDSAHIDENSIKIISIEAVNKGKRKN